MTRVLPIILFLLASFQLSAASLGAVSDQRPAEYMIYQYPNVSMIIKIEAPEAEFDSKIYGPENALIKSSGVAASRVGPLYQFVDSVDKPRQLMIKITPKRPVERARISLELIQLPDRDWKSASYGQAYKLLSSGTEEAHSNDSTTWSAKAYTLRNAARAFENLGWEEMQLWSEYYAAHLVLHKLNDVLMTLEQVNAVRIAARKAGYEDIELASLILEADALQKAAESTTGKVAFQRYEQLHAVLNQVVLLADSLNLPSETARALFSDGLAFEQQDRMDEALQKFRAALNVALTTSNSELTNEIRGTAAVAYEAQGSTAGAIELLDDISNDLEGDAGREQIENLFEKGRILNSTYRYQEAMTELGQALFLQQGNTAFASWGATGLALAQSYFSLGEMDRARDLILDSITRTRLDTNRTALIEAYGALARIYRSRNEFEQMARYREEQGTLLDSDESRVSFLFESGLDSWKSQGPRSSRAGELMAQSRRLAVAVGDSLASHRANLYQCLFRLERGGQSACAATAVASAFGALSASGIPSIALDASLIKAMILLREGKPGEARILLQDLVDDLLFFRQKLPGVLGAWYWLRKAEIFEQYLAAASAGSNGKQTLLALDRIRLVEGPNRRVEPEQQLRALLARRESETGAGTVEPANRADAEWRKRRRGFAPLIAPLSDKSLASVLSGLSRDQSILSYYFGRSNVYALLGSRNEVSMVRLGNSGAVSGQLERMRKSVESGGIELVPYLDALGKSLLRPVSKSLTRNIYLLATGPLTGFPFDALRLDDTFLAENHKVSNLVSIAATTRLGSGLASDFSDSVFLAGNPQTGQELFSYDVRLSAEINAVTDAFVGPGLTIVQGVALQKDEFQDPRFADAGLVHLAIPGTLNLARPDDSLLIMSRISEESRFDNLHPEDIRELELRASLVVLSRTVVSGDAPSGFDSRLGFVSEFLLNGARNLVVSLQSGTDLERAIFMTDFYSEVEMTRDVAEALSRSRIRLMKTTDPENFMSWAGFQLFIR